MNDPKRLESWKQVAAYLAKSERTVRRWQQTEGMQETTVPAKTRRTCGCDH